jgi:hypothetical protein
MASAAQATTHEFYKGKTIRIIVSAAAGGGFDTYSRTIARHMGKHIPGNPSLIVENMTGAGGLIAANHVYKVAKPDGLTIGNFAYPCLYLASRDRQRTGAAAASGLHGAERLEDLQRALQMGVSGEFRLLVDQIMPLREAAAAHRLVALNTSVGKIVLDPTLESMWEPRVGKEETCRRKRPSR